MPGTPRGFGELPTYSSKPVKVESVPNNIKPWDENKKYKVGSIVSYNPAHHNPNYNQNTPTKIYVCKTRGQRIKETGLTDYYYNKQVAKCFLYHRTPKADSEMWRLADTSNAVVRPPKAPKAQPVVEQQFHLYAF
jgi:hypothetical protein